MSCEADFVALHVSAAPMAAGFHAPGEAVQQAVIEEVSAQLALYESNDKVVVLFKMQLATAAK